MPTFLSHSQLGALLRCGRMYRYRYIDRKPAVMNANLVIGSVYHQAIAAAYYKKLAGFVMTEDEIEDLFSNFWDKKIADRYISDELGEPQIEATYIEWQGKDPGELKDKGIEMCKYYLNHTLPLYVPMEVESRKEMVVDGIAIVGYVDATAKRGDKKLILDHKWKEKKFSAKDLENDFQSTIYTMLTGIQDTEFHVALNQKEIKVEPQEVARSDDDINWVKVLIKEAHKQIKSGLFPPSGVMSWVCSIDYCSYYTQCRMGWL